LEKKGGATQASGVQIAEHATGATIIGAAMLRDVPLAEGRCSAAVAKKSS